MMEEISRAIAFPSFSQGSCAVPHSNTWIPAGNSHRSWIDGELTLSLTVPRTHFGFAPPVKTRGRSRS